MNFLNEYRKQFVENSLQASYSERFKIRILAR